MDNHFVPTGTKYDWYHYHLLVELNLIQLEQQCIQERRKIDHVNVDQQEQQQVLERALGMIEYALSPHN